MSLRDKIFEEFRRTKKEATHVWMPNQYIGFYNSGKLNPIERRNFMEEIKKMCDEGLLAQEGEIYRLTEKCEIAIWGE